MARQKVPALTNVIDNLAGLVVNLEKMVDAAKRQPWVMGRGTGRENPSPEETTMAEIARLNHRHEQIVNWLILNPERSLGECAAAFGYTQPWLSQLVHSDMFQARYQEACREIGELAVHTLHNKLSGLTVAVIDKALERVENGVATERFLGDTLRTSLQSLGYGGGPPAQGAGTAAPITINIQAQALVAARERVAQARAGTTLAKLDAPADPGGRIQGTTGTEEMAQVVVASAEPQNGNGKLNPAVVRTVREMLEDDGI